MAEKTNKQNGFLNFVKRNLALIIIIACVLAIVTIVVVESTKPSDPIVDVGGVSRNVPVDQADGESGLFGRLL